MKWFWHSFKSEAGNDRSQLDKNCHKSCCQTSADPDFCSLTSSHQRGGVMKYLIKTIAVGIAVLSASSSAFAEPVKNFGQQSANSFSSYMRIFGPANPPYGFVRFCSSHPQECRKHSFETTRITLTSERSHELAAVNHFVNTTIEPLTDLEMHGVTELWSLPTQRGDCEDYALLKRKMLIARGWPPSSLLLTVVRDEIGDGHAVLTIRTAQGDFVLDNKIRDVRLWTHTPYEFLMRQSYLNPKVWVALAHKANAQIRNIAVSGAAETKLGGWR